MYGKREEKKKNRWEQEKYKGWGDLYKDKENGRKVREEKTQEKRIGLGDRYSSTNSLNLVSLTFCRTL
jgi:hypothetical protein